MSKQPKRASTKGNDDTGGRPTVIYARISKDASGLELGVARQIEECRQYAESHGLNIVAEFTDNSISAFKRVQVKAPDGSKRTEKRTLPRPGYDAMLDFIEGAEPPVEVVLAWGVDRIFRQSRMLEDFIDWLDDHPGLEIAAVHGSEYNLSTSEGRQTARIIVSIATGESERKSERIRSQKAQAAKQGKRLGGGIRPFGFQGPDFNEINEAEAAHIRKWADQVIAGIPMRVIALQATADGVISPRGNTWSITTIRRLLVSARVGGKLEHNGVIVGQSEWPAILDEKTQSQVTALLEERGNRYRSGSRKPTLLAGGLAVCGLCGYSLRSAPSNRNGKSIPGLACRNDPNSGAFGCGRIKVRRDWAESFVTLAVAELLDNPELLARRAAFEANTSQRDTGYIEELKQIDDSIDRVNRFLVDGTLNGREGRKAKDELLEKQRQIEGKLAHHIAEVPVSVMLAATDRITQWSRLGIEAQRSFLAFFIKHVIVKPAVKGRTTPDPRRFEIVLRDEFQL